ncbi:MAG: hypothetical protein M1501_01030 [Candidatus Omnitrophica bacterium]|nr:hypothetical protein [Candidatus Omnitrophota bacterium]
MHPQIISDKQDDCSICGMALELQSVSLEEEKNVELIYMSRRFWICLVLTIPIIFLAMSNYIPAISIKNILSFKAVEWLEGIITTPIVLWGGWPFFVRGFNSIKNRSLNMGKIT